MPNYDAGHYFLTVLAPVRPDPVVLEDHLQSRRHALRDALARMHTAEKTASTKGSAPPHPFMGNDFTHFARFFVLDDVVYNGRAPLDGVLAGVLKKSPLTPQKIDRLSSPFLVFVADFDVKSGSDADLDARLQQLWEQMPTALGRIFQHCIGFPQIPDAAGFCVYIRKCQVETTMPFNDYWSTPPDLPVFDKKPYLYAGIAAAVVTVIGLFAWRPWLLSLGLLGIGATVFMVYRKVIKDAARPFPVSAPPGVGSDLPSVLKSLAVQRGFTAFVIETQGKSDHEIHDAFGAFIAAMRPDDLEHATQPAGVIGV